MEIDIEMLRDYLSDSYGTAVFAGIPAVMANLVDVGSASPEKLVDMAERLGLNISDFEVAD